MKDYDFNGMVDDLQYQLHPRLFLRMPVTDPLDLYKASAMVGKKKLWDCKLPINNYNFTHVHMQGIYTPKGLAQVFDQKTCDFDLAQLTGKSAAGQTKYKFQQATATLEPIVSCQPITNSQQFKTQFSALEWIHRRSDILDLSLEPVRAFLDWYDYFEGPANSAMRLGLDPGVFCTSLVNQIKHDNAQRWYKEEGFMTFTDIQMALPGYQGQIQRNPDVMVKKNLDMSVPDSASKNNTKPGTKKKTSKYCPFYNSEKGCDSKEAAFCFVNKEKKWHKCNKKLGPNSFCPKRHTRFEHDEAEKKD